MNTADCDVIGHDGRIQTVGIVAELDPVIPNNELNY